MWPSFLNVYTRVQVFSFFISPSLQLAVPKDFPIWKINIGNAFPSSMGTIFQCLNNQILTKVETDHCEYSVIIDEYSTRALQFFCTEIISMSSLQPSYPRTVSKGIYFARNHKRLPLYEIYKLRYSQFCRIVLGEERQISNLDDMPEMFSESDVFGTFYVLFLSKQESFEERVLNDTFQKLRYILFLSCNQFNNSSTQLASPNIFITSFNWNTSPLISTSDPGVPLHLGYYRRTGKWSHFILAAYHYVALKINATNDHIYVFTPPRLKSFENGIWDDYVKPVVFKEAHISVTRIRDNDVDSKYCYHTVPVYFDHFTFITAVPRDLGSNNAFFASFSDLLIMLALIILTTFGVCLIKLLEVVLSANSVMHHLSWSSSSLSAKELIKAIVGVFQTILKPILDQPMLSQATRMSAGSLEPNYIVYALWLVLVMTMSNMYKCNFVSEIVSPNFERMPDTFRSLIDLEFKTKAIFFTNNMDLKFAGAPNPVNDVLLKQTEDCNFMDPECCYQSLLRWDTACLGTKKVFESFATRFLVDERGNNMFTFSPDSLFPFFTANGVSKYFPEILELLNFVHTQMEESGMRQYIIVLKDFEEKKDGRNFARNKLSPSSEFYSVYQGNAFDTATSDGKLVIFLLKLLFVPLSISSFVFLFEIIKLRWESVRLNSIPSWQHPHNEIIF